MMYSLGKEELDQIFSALKKARFLVIGDFCLDFYGFLDQSASEISVETGLPTDTVREIKTAPGAAGNVAKNLAVMGAANISCLGVLADDLLGAEQKRLLNSLGVNTDHFVIQNENWISSTYTKLYEEGRERPRIDFGNFNRLSRETEKTLSAKMEELIPQSDVVLINQQLIHGIHSENIRKELQRLIRENQDTVFLVDSRDYLDSYGNAVRKLNDREAALTAGISLEEEDYRNLQTVRGAARHLSKRWENTVFITRAEKGGLVCKGTEIFELPGFHLTKEIDTVGAGDTVFAGIAAGYAAGLSEEKSLILGSFAAGITIQKLFQTGTASEEEIRSFATDPEYALRPEKALSLRGAEYWKESEIELISGRKPEKVAYAIFDNDGTISSLRQGWESVMEPVMMEAVLGPAADTLGESEYERLQEEVRDYIDKTTGIRTIVQMQGLVDMVHKWGLVPQDQVLTASEYKKIYLDRLQERIEERRAKIERGELDKSDFLIKGSLDLIQKLSASGVRLFLASGTDDEAAKRESELLGYARYFDGGIFGAQDVLDQDPKKIVLDSIIDKIAVQGNSQIVCFGDGPVEIRETWKKGGFSVGVASDEKRRFGLNTEKRKRLVFAGADIIIPDFSQTTRLCDFLGLA